MKPNEPSRTALMIARQRAAHQVLDHGSIVYDPFAMKILGEDEKDVLQFANGHPLASIGRLLTTARSRIGEDALSGAVEKGIRQTVILGAGLDTFALRNPHGARRVRIYEVDHPATQAWKRQRLAEAQIALPPWRYRQHSGLHGANPELGAGKPACNAPFQRKHAIVPRTASSR